MHSKMKRLLQENSVCLRMYLSVRELAMPLSVVLEESHPSQYDPGMRLPSESEPSHTIFCGLEGEQNHSVVSQ